MSVHFKKMKGCLKSGVFTKISGIGLFSVRVAFISHRAGSARSAARAGMPAPFLVDHRFYDNRKKGCPDHGGYYQSHYFRAHISPLLLHNFIFIRVFTSHKVDSKCDNTKGKRRRYRLIPVKHAVKERAYMIYTEAGCICKHTHIYTCTVLKHTI